MTIELLVSALVSGLLIGGVYASVAVGVSVAFGLLNVVNIGHASIMVLGAYAAYVVNTWFGIDPLLGSLISAPVFYFLGLALYQLYHKTIESKGDDPLRGLAFFFGVMFLVEIGLVMGFGADYRYVNVPYASGALSLGIVDVPYRLLVPCAVSMVCVFALQWLLANTFLGRATNAVAQDMIALRLMGVDPVRVKRIAFGISLATAALAGALLIIIQPVEPSINREFIGRAFAICVLGGMGSLPGMIAAAIIIGVAESFTSVLWGPSWSPAVAFGFLLLTLVIRPKGLFGR